MPSAWPWKWGQDDGKRSGGQRVRQTSKEWESGATDSRSRMFNEMLNTVTFFLFLSLSLSFFLNWGHNMYRKESDQTLWYTSCLFQQPSSWRQVKRDLSVTSVTWKSTLPPHPLHPSTTLLGVNLRLRLESGVTVRLETGHQDFCLFVFGCALVLVLILIWNKGKGLTHFKRIY